MKRGSIETFKIVESRFMAQVSTLISTTNCYKLLEALMAFTPPEDSSVDNIQRIPVLSASSNCITHNSSATNDEFFQSVMGW